MTGPLERYLGQLRDDPEPTRRALAMAQAIEQHLIDVQEDDNGDVDDVRWVLAFGAARTLVTQLRDLTTKAGGR